MIDWGKMTSDEFEDLALVYAKFKYKDYTWFPTPRKKDDNHDFYYIETDEENHEWEGWGEAKHSVSDKKIMSREKWDQTIVSGQLAKNVKHLMFVTNARIPFNYIFRAEFLKTPPYEKFEYINNCVLQQWLYNYPQFIPNSLKSYSADDFKITKKYINFNFYIVDYFTSTISLLHELNEIYSNKDYLMLILIESSYETHLDIQFTPYSSIQISPFEVVDINSIDISVGIVCLKSIIKFTECGNLSINMHVKDYYSKKEFKHKKEYIIHKKYMPQLIYNNQLKIVEDLLTEIKMEDSANQLLMIYAAKGVGKTYLLNMLLKENKLYNQVLFLTFTAEPSDCARNICTLFLALNFGVDFSDIDYWNEVCKYYQKFPDSQKSLLLSELTVIYDGTRKNNSVSALLGVQYIQKYLLKYGLSILSNGTQKYLMIVCDDVHKIPDEMGTLFSTLIKKHVKQYDYSRIILAGRDFEFCSKELYQMIKSSATEIFRLEVSSLRERKQSLSLNYNFIHDIEYYSGILSKCNSTFHLCILLKKINNFIDLNGENEALLQIEISQIYKQICSENYQLDWDDFLFYSDDFSILFPIYAYQSGLNINIFKNGHDEIEDRIDFLFNAGIIDIQGNYLLPSHDVYQSIFTKLCSRPEYETIKENTAAFFYKEIDSPYIDIYKVLPILLMLNPKQKSLYLDKSIALLNEYYKMTEYGKMNLLCEKIIQIKYLNKNNTTWTLEKLWLFYLYADCLDHCGSLYKSKEYFSLIYDNGFSKMENDSLDFLWDAKAQIFNIKYYLLEIEGLDEEINQFLQNNASKIKRTHSIQFEVAYLNSINRRMMVALLTDEYSIAENISKQYIDLANKLQNKNHQAYFYIDYARGIYQYNPYQALNYIKIAFNKFLELPNEKRRLIDTESELKYLECILENKEITELENVSERIALNGYTHIYANSLLKRAAIRIYVNDLTIAKNLLLKVSLIIELKNFPRTQLLFSNLMAAICFLEGDDKTAIQHIKVQNKLAESIGKSYRISISLSDLQERRVDFNYKDGLDFFPLETRMW